MLNGDPIDFTFMLDPIQAVQDVFSILGQLWASFYLLICFGIALYAAPKLIQLIDDFISHSTYRKYKRYYKKHGKNHPDFIDVFKN